MVQGGESDRQGFSRWRRHVRGGDSQGESDRDSKSWRGLGWRPVSGGAGPEEVPRRIKMADGKADGPAVKITDVTLRDGHQSILATRMRTEDMEPIADQIDKMGFHSVEMWGGATFDVAHRFLNEDPWERVRTLKRLMPNTPFQMLLRGQNLVGYRHYADDVVNAFVKQSAEVGIDIFRVFDALNDERNMECSFAAIKETGKHIQGTVCYSLTEERLGGPVFTLDYYVSKAQKLQEMGADSLCIKDMSGLLSPYDAYDLVKALKEKITIPIQLHTHYTSGMAAMSSLKAIEAGLDMLDTSMAPFALRSSHPSIETMSAALKDSPNDPKLDLSRASDVAHHLEEVFPKYRDYLNTTRVSVVDTQVLHHQVPGGMISNLISQLREADALDKLDQVHKELEKVREDLGYPPLVTPTSQIVGTQAVQNVLFGRYKSISGQVKDYLFGLYGRPPAPVNGDLVKEALKDYARGQTPITSRPADLLEDELKKAESDTKDIAKGIEDTLVYTLFPTTGMRYLKWKYGRETPPADVKARTLEDVEREDELIKKAKEGKLEAAAPQVVGPRTFNVRVDGQQYQVDVEPLPDGEVKVEKVAPAAARPALSPAAAPSRPQAPPPPRPTVQAAPPPPASSPRPAPSPRPSASQSGGDGRIVAPMPGTLIRYEVEVGQEVTAGQVVLIIETMKMENALNAPVDGKVTSLPCQPGQSVGKDEVLAVIEAVGAPAGPAEEVKAPPVEAKPEPAPPAPTTPEAVSSDGASVVAPMPGTLIRYEVEVGQDVTVGQTVLIIETMKMENALPSPVDGKVLSLPCQPGESVPKDRVLAVIG